jgi:Tfp pilus assembly protein PilX
MMKKPTTDNRSFRTAVRQDRQQTSKFKKGVALYIAITVTGALVLISFAIIELALRQIALSSAGRDSQEAFYAADSGSECALYWDVKNSVGRSAFATTSWTSPITCNGQSINFTPVVSGTPPLNGTSTFNITFLPEAYCATVSVSKSYSGGLPVTKIESRGYNTCVASPLRVERAIRITY